MSGFQEEIVKRGRLEESRGELVMGFAGREATREELDQMCLLVEEGMLQGAFGISTGIQYPPCVYANKDELAALCTSAGKYDGCFVVHIRNESNLSLEALDEVIDVARRSGVRLHVSHFKVSGSINRDKLQPALAKLDAARAEGIEVIGIGFGRTANEAEHKAREALAKAKSGGGGNCYLVMQDGHVLGPLGKESQLEYSVRSDDPKRIYLAQQAGLSVATINRLISYCEGCDSYQMTAAELAHGFGIAVRSARRILSTLEQAGLAEVVGEEQPVCKGRPRQIYQLKLYQKMSEGEWNE
jgi:hypothetical protein